MPPVKSAALEDLVIRRGRQIETFNERANGIRQRGDLHFLLSGERANGRSHTVHLLFEAPRLRKVSYRHGTMVCPSPSEQASWKNCCADFDMTECSPAASAMSL